MATSAAIHRWARIKAGQQFPAPAGPSYGAQRRPPGGERPGARRPAAGRLPTVAPWWWPSSPRWRAAGGTISQGPGVRLGAARPQAAAANASRRQQATEAVEQLRGILLPIAASGASLRTMAAALLQRLGLA